MKERIRTLAEGLNAIAARHEKRGLARPRKKLALSPPAEAWERIDKLHRRAVANAKDRSSYREALLCAIVHLSLAPREVRAEVFRSMVEVAKQRGSFEGLESAFLSLLDQIGREGDRDMFDLGVSAWTDIGAPGTLGGGEKASFVFDMENGTVSFVNRKGLANLGFDPRGGVQITSGVEKVSSGWTGWIGPAALAVAIVVVVVLATRNPDPSPRPDPTPAPDGGTDGGGGDGGDGGGDGGGDVGGGDDGRPDTPNPEDDSGLDVITREMAGKIAEFLSSWRGPVSDPPAEGGGRSRDAGGVKLNIADLIGGGHTDPSPEDDDEDRFRRAAKKIALASFRYRWVSDGPGWGSEKGRLLLTSIGGSSLFEGT